MFRKLFIIPAVLSGLLMLGSAAFAQHRGGHSAPAVHHSAPAVHHSAPAVHHAPATVNRGGAVTRGPVVRSGNYHYANYGGRYYHNGRYWPGYYGGWPYYSGYVPYNYGYDYSAYGYPNYSYYPPADVTLPSVTVADSAQIHVVLPDPLARVWINGQLTNSTGTDRWYTTSVMAAGTSLSYEVRASWMEGSVVRSQVQNVVATPGGTSMVYFN